MRNQSDLAAQHVREFGTWFQLPLLCNLDPAHHLDRILGEEIWLPDIELSVLNYETVDALGRGFRARQKSKKRARFGRGIAASKLRRDSFRHSKNVSTMRVDIFHQRFASQQAALLRITQSLRHRFLHVEMQNVGRAVVQIMELGSDSSKKIVGCLNPTPALF